MAVGKRGRARRGGGIFAHPPVSGARIATDGAGGPGLADAIRDRLRSALVVQADVELVPWGTLQRSEYKSKLVER